MIERTETFWIDRNLAQRARQRAREESREESDLIEDALRRYLGERSFREIFADVDAYQREHGIEPLSEEEAMKLAVDEQHAYRRGE